MKAVKKTLSILLSLVLCLGLVAPAFAAQVLNNENKGTFIGTDGALLAHDGKGGVAADEAEERFYDYELGEDVTLDQTLVIGTGVDASIEMNGHTLELNDQHEAKISSNGYLDSVNPTDSSLSDQKNDTAKKKNGSVIKVSGEGASLTVTDSSSYNEETGEYDKEGTGAISGGYTMNTAGTRPNSGGGGGVHVDNGGSFTMQGGSITENVSTYQGGAIYVNGGTVALDNVSVSQNSAGTTGGGIYAADSEVVLNDVDIFQNKGNRGSGNGGGGIHATNSTVTLTDSSVNKNIMTGSGTNGGGIYVTGGTKLTVENSEVVDNQAISFGGAIYVVGSGTTADIINSTIAKNHADSYVGGVYDATKNHDAVTIDGDTIICGNCKGINKNVYYEENVHPDSANADNPGWVGKLTKAATCKEAGEMTYTCKYCNEIRTVAIPMLTEHSWDEGAVTKAPTCAEEGETTYTCTVCGETRTESIEKVGHTPAEAVRENEVPAQVGVEGSYDEVVKCSVCGEELSREGKTIPALAEPAPSIPGTSDLPDEVVELDDEDVPLAGLPIELKPEERLTRGQIIAILHWMDGSPAARLSSFLDVAADSDFAVAIGWAQGNDIADGITESEFAPDQFVTRGQLIDFLNRYARYVGSDLVLEVEGDPGEVLTWAMAEKIINDFFTRLYA